VEALIDAYDKTVSDAQNEIEEFRLAYLLLTGAEIDEDTLIKARATGVIELPAEGDAKYLTKVLQTEFIENQKNTLERNIFRFLRIFSVVQSRTACHSSFHTGACRG